MNKKELTKYQSKVDEHKRIATVNAKVALLFSKMSKFKPMQRIIKVNKFSTAEFTQNPSKIIKSLNVRYKVRWNDDKFFTSNDEVSKAIRRVIWRAANNFNLSCAHIKFIIFKLIQTLLLNDDRDESNHDDNEEQQLQNSPEETSKSPQSRSGSIARSPTANIIVCSYI